eukprot:CAMPEP_0179433024 /NCGR_PEP_ID=MMETSP0799-20121207/17490_1 /TAXON_ID=46947 /ORGANISM="Geminigera cryophila, Strain CCMP2564" /LENGTH=58 /DNA_ID=CAMNT_0021210693 /DNA_START=241 /DNA_END=417 /DNA_ORIENTATION=+
MWNRRVFVRVHNVGSGRLGFLLPSPDLVTPLSSAAAAAATATATATHHTTAAGREGYL